MPKPIWIFDLDDTLIPSAQSYVQAIDEMKSEIDLADYQEARLIAKSRLPKGHVSLHNRALYFKAYLEKRGEYSPAEVLRLLDLYEEKRGKIVRSYWKQSKRAKLMDEICKRAKIMVVTNELTRTQLQKLSQMDPDGKWFKNVLTSEEVGAEKPDDRIFDEAESRLDHPNPSLVTFIGDSLVNDIKPSLSRGWRAIWTTEFLSKDESKHATPKGSLKIARLEEVLAL